MRLFINLTPLGIGWQPTPLIPLPGKGGGFNFKRGKASL